jgi:hypothetical protein
MVRAPEENIMRRPLVGGFACLVVAIGVSACSAGDDPESVVSNEASLEVSKGSPFRFGNPKDQKNACLGIVKASVASCKLVSDPDQAKLCAALASKTQTPCFTISNRDLRLTCDGMSVAPRFPSNCRDVSNPELKKFCNAVSTQTQSYCFSIADRDTRLFCNGFSVAPAYPSNCRDIADANDRAFCFALSSKDASHCEAISPCGEASCVPVAGAFVSHYTGPDCTGTESYYTPYFSGTTNPNPDGIRRSWDGKGAAGTILRTQTNVSYRAADGVCVNAWPSGNTLHNFVTIYR